VKLFWFPISVFIVHFFLSSFVLGIYSLLPWLDMPVHFLGGLSIAYSIMLLLFYLQNENIINSLDTLIMLILIFSLAVTAAVFWEFAEFLVDQLFGMNTQLSLSDTISDLFMGVLGGFTMTIYYGSNSIKK